MQNLQSFDSSNQVSGSPVSGLDGSGPVQVGNMVIDAYAKAGTNGIATVEMIADGLNPGQAAQGKDTFENKASPTSNALLGGPETNAANAAKDLAGAANGLGGKDPLSTLAELGQMLIQMGQAIKGGGNAVGAPADPKAGQVGGNNAQALNAPAAGAPKAGALGAPAAAGTSLEQVLAQIRQAIEQLMTAMAAMGMGGNNTAAPKPAVTAPVAKA
jgi:hypothetical protein